MLSDADVRKIAKKVVTISKASARVDTGALKRSISFTYVKEIVIFRQLFYGQFHNNSALEKNAAALMPNGTQWKIIYTSFDGDTVEVSRTRAGRKKQSTILNNLSGISSTINIKSLIAKRKAKKKKDGKA